MNGFVLGTWLKDELAKDAGRASQPGAGGYALAHNVESEAAVEAVIASLIQAGGRLLRPGDAPAHGAYRGYVADPDDHAWEIAWNPAWRIDAEGRVTFGV